MTRDSSKLRNERKSSFDLPVAVAKCGIRNALRPFLRRADVCFVAILVLERSEDVTYYDRAATELLASDHPFDDQGNDMVIVTTVTENENHVNNRHALTKVRYARRAVVFVPSLECVSQSLLLAADHIATVPAIRPEHYLVAAREIELQGMTRAIAEFLATHSLDDLKTAIRPQRPLMNAVRRLRKQIAAPHLAADAVKEPSATKQSSLRLEDTHGYGQAKSWGLQLAEDIRAWKAGVVAWEDVDRGALLFGPPGCGKTTFARALAASCGMDLVVASAARWQARGHLGDFLKAMRASFDEAKKKAPAILFLDEFDSFGDRDAGGNHENRDYQRQVINGLLEALDPAEGREGVVVIGATNHPDAIDPALLRPGRLEVTIEIPLPDDEARIAILCQHLKTDQVAGDLSFLIASTRGWSGAGLEKLARDARRHARRRGGQVIADDICAVLPARRRLTDEEMRRVAVHEAGHALVGVLLNYEELMEVFIDDHVAEHTTVAVLGKTRFKEQRRIARTAAYLRDQIAMTMGGMAAETIVFGNHSSVAAGDFGSDLAVASDVATILERRMGFGSSLGFQFGRGRRPLEEMRERDPELRELVDQHLKTELQRAICLLELHREQLDLIAEELVSERSLSGDDVLRIMCAGRSSENPVCLMGAAS
ncbi:AAA family ATPase [Pseudaminobacter soli (ex Li et al. 2025)]|uniref:ATPase n=1 Tax=Pseudaminobacter soli (ex Li et al. 2025) TaxID=1295366 RepID=A0A2P7SD23_9HYPH|nr:AAA family ATPase [Mesorhizobium soli]PSJ60399.1 ATPase [Mesorhizobium soli]